MRLNINDLNKTKNVEIFFRFSNFVFTFATLKSIGRMANVHLHGTIAQLVEQRTENPCVPGSNPGGTTQKPLQFCSGFFIFP